MTLLTRFLAFVSLTFAIAYGDVNKVMKAGSGGTDSGDEKNSVVLKTHSLFAPYLDSDLQSRWYMALVSMTYIRWEFGGDTVVDANRHAHTMAMTDVTDKCG